MRIGYFLFGPSNKLNDNGIINRYSMDTSEVMRLSGANLGNLAFKFGARKLLSEDLDIEFLTYNSNTDYVKKNIDLLILPEANLINSSVNYSQPADFIESVNKPCLLLGLGAQATDISSDINVPEGTIRYLKAVSKRTNNILVRGEFTKEKLKTLGVDNAISMGCPSFMINKTQNLFKKVKQNLNKVKDFSTLSVTEGVYPLSHRNDHINLLERQLFDLVLSDNADYIGQVQTSVISHGLKNTTCINRDDMYYLRQYLSPRTSEQKFTNIAEKRFKAFTRVDEWLEYYRSRQAVIGTRIHGNFLALQAETPALPITHDSRTHELCEAMKIPYISIEDASKIRTISDLSEKYDIIRNIDANEHDHHRESLAVNYTNVLNELDIPISKTLKHIARL